MAQNKGSAKKSFESVTFTIINRIGEPKAAAVPLLIESPYGGTHREEKTIIDPFSEEALVDPYINKFLGNLLPLGVTVMMLDDARMSMDMDRDFRFMSKRGLTRFADVTREDGAHYQGTSGDIYTDNGMGFYWLMNPLEKGQALYNPRTILSYNQVSMRFKHACGLYNADIARVIDSQLQKHRVSFHVSLQPFLQAEAEILGAAPDNMPDIAIANDFNTTSDGGFTRRVIKAFTDRGYHVTLNDLFPTGQIVKTHGKPVNHAHSLQVKIRQSLYRDPQTLQFNSDFRTVARDLQAVFADLAAFARAEIRHSAEVETLADGQRRVTARKIRESGFKPTIVK